MKKVAFIFLCVCILISIYFPSPSIAKNSNYIKNKEYVAIGKISDPLLIELLHIQEDFHPLSKKNRRVKAILLDGKHLTPTKIKANSMVQKAIKTSVPIVIAKPTKGQVGAITGADVRSDAIVIVPKKRGEEFEINLISEGNHTSYHACGFGAGGILPGHLGNWGNSRVPNIVKIINSERDRNQDEIGDFSNEAVACHKRWTVKNASPYVWGPQGQMIDVGFQYDLYYVTSPAPTRKYLTIKTVGKGASPGKLTGNNSFHRGYYQNALTVEIVHSTDEWKGEGLKCEDVAPRTDNNSGQVNVTTGKEFNFGGGIGGNNYNAGGTLNTTLYYQKTRIKEFTDFSISQLSIPNGVQWTYWMSGAGGKGLRRKHQASDLIRFKRIAELPELAKGSMLKPYLEAVYFADGDETGKQKFVTVVKQSLQDLRSFGLFKRQHNINGVLFQEATIDFSQVDAACNSSRK